MPVINWAFLCNKAYLDGAGRACLTGMFESLVMGSLPSSQPQMFVGLQVTMAGGESYHVSVEVTSPSGEVLATNNTSLTALPSGGKTFMPFGFSNVMFSETGEHRIRILFDGIPVYSLPFTVQI
jgi:hypothetical protein